MRMAVNLLSATKELLGSVRETYVIGKRIIKISFRVRKSAVLLYLSGAVLETSSSILTIYASSKLVGLLAGFISNGETEGIWFWLWVDVVAAILIGVGFWLMRYADRLIYYALNKWSVSVYTRTMLTIDINDFYDEDIRNRINKVGSNYQWQIPNITITYLSLIYSLMRFGAIATVVAQISWLLILVIAMFLLPTLLSNSKIAKIQWAVWGEKGDDRHVFYGIGQMLSKPKNQMEIRSMQTGKYLLAKMKFINNDFYNAQEKKYRKAGNVSLTAGILEVGGVAIGSVILLRQFLNGGLALDRYFFLSGALLRVGGALNAIFGTLSQLQEPQLFAQDFFKLLDSTSTMVDRSDAVELNNDKAPKIEFKNVCFKYPGKNTLIFKDLNLRIDPGEHVALVGENGAGKSTLIKLLLRFYRPTSGTILINDIDLQNIKIDSWYACLATLFQEFNEYPLPIDENIEIVNPKTKGDQKRLQEAAKFGGVDTMIKEYQHGWSTVLDSSFEKGTEPSGGQWQRVALARAFYRQANVLILDEPTSAIDAKAEYNIFNNIFNYYKNKTAIIVSHRFSTVRRATRIVVLDHGKIVEQGSHRQLMTNHGLYHELFTKQAEGYKD